jgi:hypothetical protein
MYNHHRKKHPRPSVTLALKGYDLDGADLVHAIRTWRAACHGLASALRFPDRALRMARSLILRDCTGLKAGL